jgi:hypothetical protein
VATIAHSRFDFEKAMRAIVRDRGGVYTWTGDAISEIKVFQRGVEGGACDSNVE